jgi:hypothetical protein
MYTVYNSRCCDACHKAEQERASYDAAVIFNKKKEKLFKRDCTDVAKTRNEVKSVFTLIKLNKVNQ